MAKTAVSHTRENPRQFGPVASIDAAMGKQMNKNLILADRYMRSRDLYTALFYLRMAMREGMKEGVQAECLQKIKQAIDMVKGTT